ncbi:hypothetical protein ACFXC8_35580 [Streptomyces sp. NPDC059441]|uniref:hypothetical protein n=1 Tax=Streptomyces sp. NPDC059441 TaxID=3346829 RepID=UPI0036CD30B3
MRQHSARPGEPGWPIATDTPLTEPTGLAVNAKGDIYVTSNTLSTTDGELLKYPAT